jgi:uncharacterized protein with GYD domain
MPTYVSLITFTDQGIRNVKESPNRQRRYAEMLEQAGGRLHEIYMTLGAYDAVAVFEAPDDETAARSLLILGSLGNVRSQTMKAFPRSEFEKLVQSL